MYKDSSPLWKIDIILNDYIIFVQVQNIFKFSIGRTNWHFTLFGPVQSDTSHVPRLSGKLIYINIQLLM